jgi:hypothetical protein
MLTAPQVTFHGMAHSIELERDVAERIAWLERFYPAIVSCRVAVDVPHRHRRAGRHFHVVIELTVPGREPIVVRHEPSVHGPLKDASAKKHLKESDLDSVYRYARVAVHDAFKAARRRLQDFARLQRGAVKIHAAGG